MRSRCSKACSRWRDIQVRDIMVPRAQMTVLSRDDDARRAAKTVVESAATRAFR